MWLYSHLISLPFWYVTKMYLKWNRFWSDSCFVPVQTFGSDSYAALFYKDNVERLNCGSHLKARLKHSPRVNSNPSVITQHNFTPAVYMNTKLKSLWNFLSALGHSELWGYLLGFFFSFQWAMMFFTLLNHLQRAELSQIPTVKL